MNAPNLRQSARAVVLDSADRIVLLRFVLPRIALWATPGGGLDPGETDEAALRRELVEELGLEEFEPGPCIWVRNDALPSPDGLFDAQLERYYLVRTESFDPEPRVDLRAENVHAVRWWALHEIERSTDLFAPSRLAALLRDLLEHGPPASPIDAGV